MSSNISTATKTQLQTAIAGLVQRLTGEHLNEAEVLSLLLTRFANSTEATAGTATDKFVSPATATSIAVAKAEERVQALIGAAPETLDTINEIAAALNNDPAVINNLLLEIGTKESQTGAAAKLVEAKAYADTIVGAALTTAGTNANGYTDTQLDAFAVEVALMFDAQTF